MTLRGTGMAVLLGMGTAAVAQEAPADPTEVPAEPVEAAPAAPADSTGVAPAPAEPAEAPVPVEPTGAAPAPAEAPAAPAEAPAAPAEPTEAPTPADPTALTPAPTASGPVAAPAAPSPPRIVALPPPPSVADDLPIPTLTLDRIPPSTSFEFAVQVSYGTVAYFRDQVPPWVGFGFRGGWGKNFGLHRLGLAATLAAEGDIGVHTQLALEPSLAWDFVSRSGLLVGAGVGPAAVYTSRTSTVLKEYGFDLAPSAAARIGWSQTWSRVGRRLFVFAEPKVRMAEGRLSPVVAVAVGSGGGR